MYGVTFFHQELATTVYGKPLVLKMEVVIAEVVQRCAGRGLNPCRCAALVSVSNIDYTQVEQHY
jgi:hypothetical protein